jgi:hypothetical protein
VLDGARTDTTLTRLAKNSFPLLRQIAARSSGGSSSSALRVAMGLRVPLKICSRGRPLLVRLRVDESKDAPHRRLAWRGPGALGDALTLSVDSRGRLGKAQHVVSEASLGSAGQACAVSISKTVPRPRHAPPAAAPRPQRAGCRAWPSARRATRARWMRMQPPELRPAPRWIQPGRQ